jgi:hypothetical protein
MNVGTHVYYEGVSQDYLSMPQTLDLGNISKGSPITTETSAGE